jgi:hypothetical protein
MTRDELVYYTTAEWLRGYADGLVDKELHSALIHKMSLAADLLMKVWEKERGPANAHNKVYSEVDLANAFQKGWDDAMLRSSIGARSNP